MVRLAKPPEKDKSDSYRLSGEPFSSVHLSALTFHGLSPGKCFSSKMKIEKKRINDLNRHLTKEDIWMSNKQVKRHTASCVITK